ncbi:phage tail-collar fiber domain-containing protein [Pantoea agglomerans]|uniref:phage tail protein n=1 Tax=Enterobacter agglomerans TaxID=549 RepID=UPI003EB6CEDA
MAEQYYSILTNRGKELEAASSANGTPVVIKDFVIGDGNGKAATPNPSQTALIREVYRHAISGLDVSQEQSNQWVAHLVVPADVGGFTIREVGLLTDTGELYAVANCAAIEKPVSGINVSLQFRLAVNETASIELKVATGDGLFLRQDANLADLQNKDKARNNLDLGGLALKEIGYIYDSVYPIGVVTWFAQNKDPNTLFPGTTWEYIGENRTVRLASASGSDVMTTGGSDSVTLEGGHMPAHTHSFSANTSAFDYGTKGTSGVGDHIHNAWTDTQGAHNHNFSFSYGDFRNDKALIPNGGTTNSGISQLQTDIQGGHGHNVGIGGAGGHGHTVDIGAHSHSVSGTTSVAGSGAAFSVANAFIKLMGWYRSA